MQAYSKYRILHIARIAMMVAVAALFVLWALRAVLTDPMALVESGWADAYIAFQGGQAGLLILEGVLVGGMAGTGETARCPAPSFGQKLPL